MIASPDSLKERIVSDLDDTEWSVVEVDGDTVVLGENEGGPVIERTLTQMLIWEDDMEILGRTDRDKRITCHTCSGWNLRGHESQWLVIIPVEVTQ